MYFDQNQAWLNQFLKTILSSSKIIKLKTFRFIHSFPKNRFIILFSLTVWKPSKISMDQISHRIPRGRISNNIARRLQYRSRRDSFFFLRDNIGLQTYYLYLTLSVIPSRGCIKRKSSRLVKWDSVTMRVCL